MRQVEELRGKQGRVEVREGARGQRARLGRRVVGGEHAERLEVR